MTTPLQSLTSSCSSSERDVSVKPLTQTTSSRSFISIMREVFMCLPPPNRITFGRCERQIQESILDTNQTFCNRYSTNKRLSMNTTSRTQTPLFETLDHHPTFLSFWKMSFQNVI